MSDRLDLDVIEAQIVRAQSVIHATDNIELVRVVMAASNLITEVRRLREQRREALSLANVRVAQWERESSTPGVWATDIRDALEADDE